MRRLAGVRTMAVTHLGLEIAFPADLVSFVPGRCATGAFLSDGAGGRRARPRAPRVVLLVALGLALFLG